MAPRSKAQETGEKEAEKSGARVVGVYAVANDGVKTLVRTYSADIPSHNEVSRKVDGEFKVSPMPFTEKAEQFAEIQTKETGRKHVVEKIK